jgi:hypothetical protein
MMSLEQAKAILAAIDTSQPLSAKQRAEIAEAIKIVSGAWAVRPS